MFSKETIYDIKGERTSEFQFESTLNIGNYQVAGDNQE
jgi:hypothetical protein